MVVDSIIDNLSVVVLLGKLKLDECGHVDVHHLKLILELGCSLSATTARWSSQDNAFHFTIK